MKKQIIIIVALLFSVTAFAQNGQRILYPTSETWTKVIPIDMGSVNSNSAEFTISKNGGGWTTTAKALSSKEVKSGKNYNVSGKINFQSGVKETPMANGKSGTTAPNSTQTFKAKLKLGGKEFDVLHRATLNTDGSFSFTGIPKGTYQLYVNDQVVAIGWKIGGE